MGAPAISPRTRPAPRPKPRPAAKPKTPSRSGSRAAAPARKSTRSAAAPARKPARRSPATAPRTNHRSRTRVTAGGNVAMLPVNAVSGIADSGFVVGMSRGRAWIVVLGVLLGGIVALNVVGLSLSASSGSVSAKIDDLQEANSVARARIANRLSNERITEAATALGLAVPAPDAVHYLDAGSSDAEKAAQRLADGLIANEPPTIEPSEADLAAEAATTTTTTTDPAVVDPTAVAVDPAATTVDPAATATTTVDPTATVPTAIP